MPNLLHTSRARLRQGLLQIGGVFGFMVIAISFCDWLLDSLALG